MLPKLSYPTFETTIPSTGAKIKYRPMLVKEHKTMLKAVEFKDETNLIETFKNVVQECTFNAVDASKLAMFDVDWLFLKIKGASSGTINKVTYKCENVLGDGTTCGTSFGAALDINSMTVSIPPKESMTIMVTDSVGIQMRYPTFENYVTHNGLNSLLDVADQFVCDCVESVFTPDGVQVAGTDFTREELKEFMDEMDDVAVDKISAFIASIPEVEMRVKIRCPKCKNEEEVIFRGLEDFLE